METLPRFLLHPVTEMRFVFRQRIRIAGLLPEELRLSIQTWLMRTLEPVKMTAAALHVAPRRKQKHRLKCLVAVHRPPLLKIVAGMVFKLLRVVARLEMRRFMLKPHRAAVSRRRRRCYLTPVASAVSPLLQSR